MQCGTFEQYKTWFEDKSDTISMSDDANKRAASSGGADDEIQISTKKTRWSEPVSE